MSAEWKISDTQNNYLTTDPLEDTELEDR